MKSMVIALLLLGGAAAAVGATPPDSIKLSFDPATHILAARVFHPVQDQFKHYIGTINVMLNNGQVIQQKFFSQTDRSEQRVEYVMVDAGSGTHIDLTAICIIFGKMTVTLTIP